MNRWMLVVAGSALFGMAVRSRAQDVQVLVTDVIETRTTAQYGGRCELKLKFMGDILADCRDILTVRVRRAADDTGRDIRLDDQDQSGSGLRHSKTNSDIVIEQGIRLRIPARNAKVIRLIEGEADVFCPTEANGGMVTVRDFLKKPGELLATGALHRAHLQVTCLTKELAEAKQKQMEEERNQPAPGETVIPYPSSSSPPVIRRIPFRREPTPTGSNDLQFLVADPDRKLVDLAFLDAAGKAIQSYGSSYRGSQIRTWHLSALPPPEMQLIIYVATPESVKTVPFKIENIPLP